MDKLAVMNDYIYRKEDIMANIMSKELYTTQTYCEKFLGFCPFTNGEEDELRHILDARGLSNLWDYPLDEVNEIIENNGSVVLVNTSYVNDNAELIYEYRWFEIPE